MRATSCEQTTAVDANSYFYQTHQEDTIYILNHPNRKSFRVLSIIQCTLPCAYFIHLLHITRKFYKISQPKVFHKCINIRSLLTTHVNEMLRMQNNPHSLCVCDEIPSAPFPVFRIFVGSRQHDLPCTKVWTSTALNVILKFYSWSWRQRAGSRLNLLQRPVTFCKKLRAETSELR